MAAARPDHVSIERVVRVLIERVGQQLLVVEHEPLRESRMGVADIGNRVAPAAQAVVGQQDVCVPSRIERKVLRGGGTEHGTPAATPWGAQLSARPAWRLQSPLGLTQLELRSQSPLPRDVIVAGERALHRPT